MFLVCVRLRMARRTMVSIVVTRKDRQGMRTFHCSVDKKDTIDISDHFLWGDLEIITRSRERVTLVHYLSVEDVKALHNHLADVLDKYHTTSESVQND
jgi:hypothetical protein